MFNRKQRGKARDSSATLASLKTFCVCSKTTFQECNAISGGADTAVLREAWQRAMQAEEKSSEALLDAWSASITTSERVEVAVKASKFPCRVEAMAQQ